MLQSTSTSGTGSSSSNSSGGHQSAVKEQHLGPTISNSNTVALHSLQSGDCDVAVHVHRPTVSCTSSSNSNTYTLFLSFAVTFVAVHQLLVHPLLTLLMTSSSTTTSTSQTSHYHAKRCVETSEPNIFHCTDHATTPSRSNSKNSGGGDHKRNSYRQSNEQQRGKDHNNIVLQDNHNKDDDVITNEYRGVAQYVLGSEEEMRDIAEVLQSMEQYWRRWMLKTASFRQQYDEIEFANIWYVVCLVICLVKRAREREREDDYDDASFGAMRIVCVFALHQNRILSIIYSLAHHLCFCS